LSLQQGKDEAMAKKRKPAKKQAPTEPVRSSEVRQQIAPTKLRELMRSARTANKDMQEIAGTLGAEVKAAVEKHHLHRKAFSVCKTADRMEPEKLLEFLDSLDYYLDVSGLRKRAESAQRLALGAPATAGEDDDAEPDPAPNVRAFPPPVAVGAD
jgi:hypothetical protein